MAETIVWTWLETNAETLTFLTIASLTDMMAAGWDEYPVGQVGAQVA